MARVSLIRREYSDGNVRAILMNQFYNAGTDVVVPHSKCRVGLVLVAGGLMDETVLMIGDVSSQPLTLPVVATSTGRRSVYSFDRKHHFDFVASPVSYRNVNQGDVISVELECLDDNREWEERQCLYGCPVRYGYRTISNVMNNGDPQLLFFPGRPDRLALVVGSVAVAPNSGTVFVAEGATSWGFVPTGETISFAYRDYGPLIGAPVFMSVNTNLVTISVTEIFPIAVGR